MTHTAPSPIAVIVLTALLVGVSGCTSPAPPPPSPESEAEPTDDQNSASDESSNEESGRNPQTVEECLTARWVLNNETWQAMLQPTANAAGATVDSVTGELVLELLDTGLFATTYTGWTVTTVQEGGAAVIERNGQDLGEWTVSGFSVELFVTSPGSSVVGYVDTAGGRIDLPTSGEADAGSLEAFEYECAPEDLLATIDLGTVFFTLAP